MEFPHLVTGDAAVPRAEARSEARAVAAAGRATRRADPARRPRNFSAERTTSRRTYDESPSRVLAALVVHTAKKISSLSGHTHTRDQHGPWPWAPITLNGGWCKSTSHTSTSHTTPQRSGATHRETQRHTTPVDVLAKAEPEPPPDSPVNYEHVPLPPHGSVPTSPPAEIAGAYAFPSPGGGELFPNPPVEPNPPPPRAVSSRSSTSCTSGV